MKPIKTLIITTGQPVLSVLSVLSVLLTLLFSTSIANKLANAQDEDEQESELSEKNSSEITKSNPVEAKAIVSQNKDQKRFIIASSFLPLEFQFLIESYQKYNLLPPQKLNFKQCISVIDKNIQLLPKKYFFLLTKSIIYKEVLESSIPGSMEDLAEGPNPSTTTNQNAKLTLNKDSINLLDSKISENDSNYYSFIKWIFISIEADLIDQSKILDLNEVVIKFDPRNKKYSASIKRLASNPKTNKEQKEALKRLELILPWYKFILSTSPADINQQLFPLLDSILNNILVFSSVLINFSDYKNGRVKELNNNSEYYNFELGANSDEYPSIKDNEKKDILEEILSSDNGDYNSNNTSDSTSTIDSTSNSIRTSTSNSINTWKPADEGSDLKNKELNLDRGTGKKGHMPNVKSGEDSWRPK